MSMVQTMHTERGVLLLVGFLMAATRGRVAAQGSPCLSDPDTAASHIWYVQRTVTFSDSTVLVNEGLPYRPAQGVTLVTDSLTCQRVIDANNALIAPSDTVTKAISRAYVLRVGTTAYALIPENNSDAYMYFDSSTLTLLAGMVAPH